MKIAIPTSRLGWFAVGALLGATLTRFMKSSESSRLGLQGESPFLGSEREVDTSMSSEASLARPPLTPDEVIPDRVLIYRVRQKFPIMLRHPRLVHVSADQGEVTLYGSLYRDELEDLMLEIQDVKGVKNIINNLRVHDLPSEEQTNTSPLE